VKREVGAQEGERVTGRVEEYMTHGSASWNLENSEVMEAERKKEGEREGVRKKIVI